MEHVPEWFPGAGFKTFARVARGKFDVAIDGPLDYVKELMKVSLKMCLSKLVVDHGDNADESNRSGNASIAWSCVDRVLESESPGLNESVVRGTTATMYIGEELRGSCKTTRLELLYATSGGRDCEWDGSIYLFVC